MSLISQINIYDAFHGQAEINDSTAIQEWDKWAERNVIAKEKRPQFLTSV